MKKFKSIITTTIVSALAVSSLMACSSDVANTNKPEETTEATTTTTQATTEATSEATTTSFRNITNTTDSTEFYHGVDVTFTAEIRDDVDPDYIDSESADSKVVVFTPSEDITDIYFSYVETEFDENGYPVLTDYQSEPIGFIVAAEDNPIAIQMDLEDGEPTRALMYTDAEDFCHLVFIQYDEATDTVSVLESHSAG